MFLLPSLIAAQVVLCVKLTSPCCRRQNVQWSKWLALCTGKLSSWHLPDSRLQIQGEKISLKSVKHYRRMCVPETYLLCNLLCWGRVVLSVLSELENSHDCWKPHDIKSKEKVNFLINWRSQKFLWDSILALTLVCGQAFLLLCSFSNLS